MIFDMSAPVLHGGNRSFKTPVRLRRERFPREAEGKRQRGRDEDGTDDFRAIADDEAAKVDLQVCMDKLKEKLRCLIDSNFGNSSAAY